MARAKVWFDFENTPHVLFLEPIVHHVAGLGAEVVVTARPQAQTLALATHRHIQVQPVGDGDRVGTVAKAFGAMRRALALARCLSPQRPTMLVSSSRTASLAAWWLGIPAVGLVDYEHARHGSIAFASDTVWLPDILKDAALPSRTQRVAKFFAGLKENLYLDSWEIDRERARTQAGMQAGDFFVVARPPAEAAHYGTGNAQKLFHLAIDRMLQNPMARVVVLPRTARQKVGLEQVFGERDRLHVAQTTVTGPELVGAADLVLGGGGTMNREAAVLGVPVWSLFDGPRPIIDEQLSREGRLRWLQSAGDVESLFAGPLPRHQAGRGPYPQGLQVILRDVERHLDLN